MRASLITLMQLLLPISRQPAKRRAEPGPCGTWPRGPRPLPAWLSRHRLTVRRARGWPRLAERPGTASRRAGACGRSSDRASSGSRLPRVGAEVPLGGAAVAELAQERRELLVEVGVVVLEPRHHALDAGVEQLVEGRVRPHDAGQVPQRVRRGSRHDVSRGADQVERRDAGIRGQDGADDGGADGCLGAADELAAPRHPLVRARGCGRRPRARRSTSRRSPGAATEAGRRSGCPPRARGRRRWSGSTRCAPRGGPTSRGRRRWGGSRAGGRRGGCRRRRRRSPPSPGRCGCRSAGRW